MRLALEIAVGIVVFVIGYTIGYRDCFDFVEEVIELMEDEE